MKTLLLLLPLILLSTACQPDCSTLKDGTFEFTYDDGKATVVTREGNRQVESFNNGERVAEYQVEWLNNCEYLLYSRRAISGPDWAVGSELDTLRFQILNVQEDSFTIQGTFITRNRPSVMMEGRILE